MSQQQDWLGRVVNEFGGEAGMLLGEVDDAVLAGDVGGGDDGELGPVEVGVKGDGGDASAGDGGADGGSVPHVRERDVVDVLGAAGDFREAFLANGGCSDDGAGLRHRG